MKNDYKVDPDAKIRLNWLESVIGKVDLTKGERATLKWISEQEDFIVSNLISIIRQARKTEEVAPMWIEEIVYTVRVYFKDGTSDDYFTECYDEIPTIKKRIWSEYDPDEIEEIVSSEEPELHSFLNPEYRRTS